MIEAKQARAQKTRSTLLSTAQNLFNTKGFDGVTAEEIARSAGVSKGTVFAHFGDKLGLLAELGQQEMNRHIAALEAAASDEPDQADTRLDAANLAELPDPVERADPVELTNPAELTDPVDAIFQGLDGLLNHFESQPEFLRLFIDQTTLRQGIHAEVFNQAITRLNRALKSLIERHKAQHPALELESDLTSTALRAYLLHLAVGQVCGEYKTREERQETLRQLLATLLSTPRSTAWLA